MKAIDLQAQIPTPRGIPFDPATVPQFEAYLKKKLDYNKTEVEFADELRKADLRVMVLAPTMWEKDIDRIRAANDYVHQLAKDHSDCIIGGWASISPLLGIRGFRELERCLRDLSFVGYYTMGAASEIPANDKLYNMFYELCIEARVPVKINVGHTARGVGAPGGGGLRLELERPLYLDDVAARFPELTVIAAHCPWPWHQEMISILLHKANVYFELHGWAPRYIPAEIKKEVNSRLQDKILFASDYPFLSYERLFAEWEGEGLRPKVIQKMYHQNAERVWNL